MVAEMNPTREMGRRIRETRNRRGWSQVELAAAAGVSRPTIARVERGDDVSTVTLTKVTSALGMVVQLSTPKRRKATP